VLFIATQRACLYESQGRKCLPVCKEIQKTKNCRTTRFPLKSCSLNVKLKRNKEYWEGSGRLPGFEKINVIPNVNKHLTISYGMFRPTRR
jgi:hypothetical protein